MEAYFGSSALIADANSIIGCAAFHMRSKWASNLAVAPASRITIAQHGGTCPRNGEDGFLLYLIDMAILEANRKSCSG